MTEKIKKTWTHSDVAMFVPNWIGYARFGSLALSTLFAMDKERYVAFAVTFTSSYLLDALDGRAARMFDQSSRYGAALDMVCDRASNATIYMVLSVLYPAYSFVFYLCFLLDFGSHWLQFQSSALSGAHHKGKNKKENWLVDLYYNNSTVFNIVVPCAEFASGGLFLMARSDVFADSKLC